MLNIMEVHETNQMIEQEKLASAPSPWASRCSTVRRTTSTRLATTFTARSPPTPRISSPPVQAIERDYGIPIVNKRITVTPISLVGASSCKTSEDFVKIAHALDKAAKEVAST
mgnify:CR=1 FL=1